jgi:hypothetical protein
MLRHHERREVDASSESPSIGVLLTRRTDGYREWDTTVVGMTGDLELPEEELADYRSIWNTHSSPTSPVTQQRRSTDSVSDGRPML